jgi:hypothetical protein
MAKGEIFTGLPKWAQGLIAVAIVGGVGFVGYKIYKKLQLTSEEKGGKEELNSASDLSKELEKKMKPTLNSYQLNSVVNQLVSALSNTQSFVGFGKIGVSESTLYKAFANVKNDLDVINLVRAYGIKTLPSNNFFVENFKGTLNQALTTLCTKEQLDALNNMLSRKGIKYRF